MKFRIPGPAVSGLVLFALILSSCGAPPKLTNFSSAELYKMGKEKYDKKKYYRAIEIFQNLVYSHAGDPVVDTAQYYLGMSYYGNEEYQLAMAEFNRLLVNYPSSPFAVEAQFMRAASAYESAPKSSGLDQSELVPSLKQFEDFVTDFPESDLIPQAKEYLLKGRTRLARKTYESGIVYYRLETFDAANIYFQKVVDDYFETEYAPKATYMLAEGEFRMKHFDVARDKFAGFAKVFPKHPWVAKAQRRSAEAAFRFGLSAYELREYDKARERFETFKKTFPDDKLVKSADAYLAKLKDLPVAQPQSEKADS